ncbi:MAG: TonB-dependent receptor, partial [Nitrosomonas sp. PRO5]|nr:TonB-dependent receptor [Nitrosomonas sp. PRO5]
IIMFSGFAQAQSNKVLSIPAQNLPDALHSLSSQTGIQILFTAEQLKGFQSPAIDGSMNTEQALIRLLQGTSYTWLASGQNTYVIKSAAEMATVMPEVRVTGSIVPDTPGNPSYTRTNASTATKSNLPIMKTPMSVQVIPRAVIEDQQAVQVNDAVRNVSGVFPGFTFGGMSQAFMIRGFDTGFASFRDGFRFPLALRFSLANIERVEVLKGAASNLYGRIEPGGMVNLVTKRPQAARYYSLNQQFGSYGQFQTLADATGALNETGTLLYRLNFEYLNQDSFRDFGFNKRIFVAPSVRVRVFWENRQIRPPRTCTTLL